MENSFLQLINELRKGKEPDLTVLTKEELIDYIKNNYNTRDLAVSFIKGCLLSVQQSYFDSFMDRRLSTDPVSFTILEGNVTYYPETQKFTFLPNDTVKKLFEDSKNTCSTKLKNILITRFYKMIEASFKIETEISIDKKV